MVSHRRHVWIFVGSECARGIQSELDRGRKKRRQISFYTTMTLSQSKKVVDAFQKKYPFITPELFRGGGDEVLNRIQNEARGGLLPWMLYPREEIQFFR